MKKSYVSPTLELFEFEVERGYALSVQVEDCFIGDVSNEKVTEGEHSKIFSEDLWY